ncbi:MAG: DNA mismatch endonuclease Vsr [Erysipelotrichaceae bacterium]|nr:DNA mismatch endonuclease Vsr [Erysipelotrichaceae bacterium]
MADTKSREERSTNMAAIRSKDTKPEVYLRKLLFSNGYRYRKYSKSIYGHPDLWLKKYNTAVFVNGCFWHRHKGCKYSYMPKSREDYWEKKFESNMARDEKTKEMLAKDQHKCLVVWECTINNAKRYKEEEGLLLERIIRFLNSDEEYNEF